jgi:hypothetical protein
MTPEEKFLEILDRHGIPAELETTTIAMNRQLSSGKSIITFYGVGQAIPDNIRREIQTEVFPLVLDSSGTSIVISNEVLEPGEPRKRQNDWNNYCSELISCL